MMVTLVGACNNKSREDSYEASRELGAVARAAKAQVSAAQPSEPAPPPPPWGWIGYVTQVDSPGWPPSGPGGILLINDLQALRHGMRLTAITAGGVRVAGGDVGDRVKAPTPCGASPLDVVPLNARVPSGEAGKVVWVRPEADVTQQGSVAVPLTATLTPARAEWRAGPLQVIETISGTRAIHVAVLFKGREVHRSVEAVPPQENQDEVPLQLNGRELGQPIPQAAFQPDGSGDTMMLVDDVQTVEGNRVTLWRVDATGATVLTSTYIPGCE